MATKPSWDDLSSLKLEMDTGGSDDNASDDGSAATLTTQEITDMQLEAIKGIPVQVTVKNTILSPKGTAVYLKQDGMCFSLPGHNLPVKTILLLEAAVGKQVFTIEAYIHDVTGDRIEVKFMEPSEEYTEFFKDMLATKVLNYKI